MKKTQVALAALALVASSAALAEVTIYGTLDAAIANSTGKGTYLDGTGSWTAPSHLGFRGEEDLGGGLKANFNLETGVSLNQGAATSGGYASFGGSRNGALFTRVATIGLSGDFGAVSIGQQLSPFIIPVVVGGGAGMGPGSFFVNRLILSGYGAAALSGPNYTHDGFFQSNSIQYTTPSISGWTVTAMTTTKAAAGDGVIGASDPAESYQAYTVAGAVGSIGLMGGYQTRKNTYSSWVITATAPLTESLSLAANYISNDETKGALSGLKINSTGGMLNYKLSDVLSTQFAYAQNDTEIKQKLTSLSMKYDLSKRTFAYASWARGTGGAAAAFADRGAMTFTDPDASNNSLCNRSCPLVLTRSWI